MVYSLTQGAVFVADAHCASYRPALLTLLQHFAMHPPPQLVLMGDMFDVLVGDYAPSLRMNQKAVACLRALSRKTDLFYLEGNHDYNLASVFPHARVFSREEQPIQISFKDQKLALAHGDIGCGMLYAMYMRWIRSFWVIKTLEHGDNMLGGIISRSLNRWLASKDLCRIFDGFELLAQRRISTMKCMRECDVLIEGHYHQGKSFQHSNGCYFNLEAHACNQSHYVLEWTNGETVLRKAIL
jgi:UDP-2,3-diacylglucosamine hydrolase